MAKMKVIRDVEGKIINIGEWDYLKADEPYDDVEVVKRKVPARSEDGLWLDAFGQPRMKTISEKITVTKTRTVVNNPLPKGAVESTADIVTGWDGGLYEASDPRRNKP